MTDSGRRPKLLFLVSEDWYFASHRLPLAIAAKAEGFEVAVATRLNGSQAHRAIEAAGVRVIPIAFERTRLGVLDEGRTIAALIRLYRAERPDIVHQVAIKPVIYGSLAARVAGVPGVVNAVMGLGYVFSSNDAKARVLRLAVRPMLGAALKGPNTRVIVQNRDDLSLFSREGLSDSRQMRLIRGSGVDPAHYSVERTPGEVPMVVLPARLLRDKGVLEFADAAAKLKDRGVKARFVICGAPDPLNPASLTDDDIAALGRAGDVELWGWQKDMGPVWRQADLVCLPSYREGLPKALLEAAASGLPVVATDVPGCREIVRPGENGWLVPARDGRALADALAEALASEGLRRRYGRRGREMVEQEFALPLVARQTIDLYRELLARGEPRSRE
jgi:glycosyltransferase involved in cell wall biosynthesis